MGLGKRHPLKPNKIKKVKERADGVCEHEDCEEKIDDSNSEIHHIIAIEDGGDDSLNNLALICNNCHLKISQHNQLAKVKIEQCNQLLRRNPEMLFFRRKKLENSIKFYENELKKKFYFKNRDVSLIQIN